MAMDLYQRLGLKRGASEAEIKKAYRSLAKQLHPDRNKDNPQAARSFAEVTRAYDLLSDKDKRAQYDRGEIDEEGNPRMPFGGGFGGGPAARGAGPGGRRFRGLFDRISATRPTSATCSKGCSEGRRAAGEPAASADSPAGSPPQKGADIAYRLKVPFVDAATLAPQRIKLADGKTIDLKLPKGVEDGTKIRLAGKGEPGPAGPGDAIVTISIAPHPFFKRDGNDIRLDLPVTLKEAVLGAKVKVPTPEGPVMMTIPKGSSSGKVLRLKGRGFTGKTGARGDLLVTIEIHIPSGDRRSRGLSPKSGTAAATRARAGGLAATMQDHSPLAPEERSKQQASLAAAFGRDVAERLKPGAYPFEVIKRVRSASTTTASSTPEISPSSRSSRCSPSSSSRPRSRPCSARRKRVDDRRHDPFAAAARRSRERFGSRFRGADARTGPLLWLGALVGLWTAGSFVETVRDILRRAYGVKYSAPFWEYRLASIALILGAVIVLMFAFARPWCCARSRRRSKPGSRSPTNVATMVAYFRIRPGVALFGHHLRVILRADARLAIASPSASNGPARCSSPLVDGDRRSASLGPFDVRRL
jgi:DnaJ-class molecular chaperone